MEVIQPIDRNTLATSWQSSVILTSTCSTLSLKPLPKKISKEPRNLGTAQTQEFQGGVKYLPYLSLRSYSSLAVLVDVVLYKDRVGQYKKNIIPTSCFPHSLPHHLPPHNHAVLVWLLTSQ